ncbi:hypothetical protein H6F90_01730 [Trichocoleus sp. FACHB-591]|uniref:hypothetical protein n=1 Tax=Trichocoleus sp. FACHB-591 TaxID=2692872 RepID=UPI0016865E6A|nr:hypothetical protein [Trichocoleus sp. FACHB-591]MBD2093874.1 hypothetical protein [Trichocoleus sp. FACHB-591]
MIINGMEKHLDAQCVGIVKVLEDEESADYIFYCSVWICNEALKGRLKIHQSNFGRARILKVSGEVEIIDPMPDDVGGRRASATASKLRQHWKLGNFPKVTTWAS